MKAICIEKIETRTAYSRKMYCPHCGSHEYEIVEQLEPMVVDKWFIRCAQCEYEGPESPDRSIAIARWKQL